MPIFSAPPSSRRFYPSPVRRIVFAAMGLAAVAARLLTAPARWCTTKKRDAVLIVEPYGMGDVLLLQPLVRAHLAAGHNVTLAACGAWLTLFPAHERLHTLAFAPAWAHKDASRKYRNPLADFIATVRTLRPFARGAEAIEPRGDARMILALWCAGAVRVRSLPRYFSANDCALPSFAATFAPICRDASRRAISEGFAPHDVPYPARASLVHLFENGTIPAPDSPRKIGLVPLTPWHGKRWSPARWNEFLPLLAKLNVEPVLLCGPKEVEASREALGNGEIAQRMPALEAASVDEWTRNLARCAALITVNTGPMHIFDTFDRAQIVLDGASRLPLWAPECERSIVLHHQNETTRGPCHPEGDGLDVQRDVMDLITPEEVAAALSRIL